MHDRHRYRHFLPETYTSDSIFLLNMASSDHAFKKKMLTSATNLEIFKAIAWHCTQNKAHKLQLS